MTSQSRSSALFFNANKVLNCQELILNLPILNLICLKHRRLHIEVEIEVELTVFYGFKTAHFFPNSEKGYRAVKRVLCGKLCNLKINQRRINTFVTEKIFDAQNIHPIFQKMRRKTVPKRMNTHFFQYFCRFDACFTAH